MCRFDKIYKLLSGKEISIILTALFNALFESERSLAKRVFIFFNSSGDWSLHNLLKAVYLRFQLL